MPTPNYAVVIPMANEALTFELFISEVKKSLDHIGGGRVYIVIDNVSRDSTLNLSKKLSDVDHRFITVWAPENKNVVDAYLSGYRRAYDQGHDYIIEMDAGMSHHPKELKVIVDKLANQGYECVFGSRFIKGGRVIDPNTRRTQISKVGTLLSNTLLGTRLKDATSGYQGFTRELVGKFLSYTLQSHYHFYQTELRYLFRHRRFIEIPIEYQAPSPSVSNRVIKNSIFCLLYYFIRRISFRAKSL